MSSTLPFEPARGDAEQLTAQLLASLPGPAQQPGLDTWRRYRNWLVGCITQNIVKGELDAPKKQHARMHVFLPFIQDHANGDGVDEARQAAIALQHTIEFLETQAHALREPIMERKVRDPASAERAVMLAFLHNTPLSPLPSIPPETVIEILRDLLDIGLIVKTGAGYRLWNTGRALCVRVGLTTNAE